MHNDSEWPKMKVLIQQWCHKMLSKDIKMSFMREHNHGVIVKHYRSKVRLMISIVLLLFRKYFIFLF